MSFEITVPHRALVVEREHDEPAYVVEFGPALGLDRFGQARELSPHPVRSQNLALLEDGKNLGVHRIELVLPERNRAGGQCRGGRLP